MHLPFSTWRKGFWGHNHGLKPVLVSCLVWFFGFSCQLDPRQGRLSKSELQLRELPSSDWLVSKSVGRLLD